MSQPFSLKKNPHQNLTVGFTTRLGGVSDNQFSSLNLGLHTEDSKENIIKNRLFLSEKINIKPEKMVFMNQTHSDNISIINKLKNDNGFYSLDTAVYNTDAIISKLSNTALCVMTADCVPVLIFEKSKNIIAAVHSGWKGCVENIVLKTIKKIINNFSIKDISQFFVFIGPAICGNYFQS